jgi:hypothetical protein
MSGTDPARALRAASDLRALCLALPHVPTPAEADRLARFERLAAAPASAGVADVDSVVAGWRQWWRLGRVDELLAMARALPAHVVQGDRHLASLAVAAAVTCAERDARKA